ncbi:MAG: phytanoyl-CoA dioxygenase family protein [Parvibaculum sp.]|uniref:phytanoyl-CoA dioxygenase family protein n=1 Tax=Parvibaculum sp. TaxID=2024848 RepID=UPI0025DDD568|nr:phytanoyl-CoA dioxygenase family protein [Parvibaculum sp.]MCE9649517.1 phytanoyl-CoA dioxygenase family protein [Parvibaculum sp.]
MNQQEAEKHIATIADHGYTIVENAIAPDLIDALNEELLRLERKYNIVPAKNGFEGHNTVRIYNLLAYGKLFERIPVHQNVLPVVEGVLDKECLISSLSSISIDPGEIAQPIHADDQIMPVEKPHAAFVCNSMWALTDFTEENGATRIIPGTHKADASPNYGQHYDSIPAEMPKGSVLIWHGSLWHGGGANKSGARRVGIAMNYCAGYIRQQENQQLGLPLDLVKTFEPRLQELCGFGTYRALIGHIDKKTPSQRLLGETRDLKSIWDLAEG